MLAQNRVKYGGLRRDFVELRELHVVNEAKNVGSIESEIVMSEKIIMLQDGTIFNGRNIIKILCKHFGNNLFKVYIQDISEEYTEIYRGEEKECQSYLYRLSIILNGPDSVVRLEDVFED